MSTLQLNANYTSGSYSTDLMNLLMPEENNPLADPNSLQSVISANLSPKYDGGKSIAIGYGLDLLNNSIATINKWLSAANLTLSASDIALINQAKANPTPANLTLIASQLQLALPSEPAAEAVLQKILIDKETGLTQLLGNNGITIGVSLERIALMSLFYNSNGGVTTNNLIGSNLLTALQNGNRAEAWYEIRYGTNKEKTQGIANRRYKESNEFGLYDSGTVNLPEALQVYHMYTEHSSTMIPYDASNGGNTTAQLQTAATFLDGIYGFNFNALNIYDTSAPGSIMFTGTNISRSSDSNADLLIGGAGNDTLTGGTGSVNGGNVYVYMAPTNGTTTETINDSRDKNTGSIYIGSTQLTTASTVIGFSGMDATSTVAKPIFDWIGADGKTIYQYTPYDLSGGASGTGTLTISGGALSTPGDKIVINDFVMSDAQSATGYLGIHLADPLAIMPGTSDANPFVVGSPTPANQTVSDAVGNGQTFSVYGAPGSTGQLTCSGAYGCVNGATMQLFSSGPVNFTIPAGQDYVTLTLVDLNNSGTADTATLTATMTDASGTVTSNNLTVNFANPADTTPANVITGTASTATINGVVTPITVYSGDGANDQITTGGGLNSVNGGNGSNVIVGNGGQDILISGNGNNQIYANAQVDLATALVNQKGATATGQKGDLIAVGDGNNTIVGGSGNDAIFTGTGNNTLVLGPGAVTVLGGVEVGSAQLNWTEVNNVFSPITGASAPFNAPTPYNGSTFNGVPVGMGNDTTFGGTGNSQYWLSNGNNWLDAGGGNDYIHAGIGNNTIFGGIGNDTIWGGGGSNYINLESGNDRVVLNGGNSTVIGGSGNDTIYSGDSGANWADSQTTANNYIYGGSGNSIIYGSGGNDTLIGGTGNASIFGGNGNEYIAGGEGNVSIVGGNGNDTIYAGGNGNDTIWAGDGNTSIYGGNGSDILVGGAGTDVISAGDGGTTNAPTYVYAGSGTSTINGGAGVDMLFGGSGIDTLVAGTGTSTLTGGSGTEVIYSNGNDTLIAGTGSDTLYGGGGTDVLQGSSGNTLFVAGSGNETIVGGSGSNTYLFNAGFGNVELGNAKNSDTFEFGPSISLADLTVSATIGSDGSNALLIKSDTGGQLIIDGGLDRSISSFVFLDPVTLSLDQMMAQAHTTPTTVSGVNGNLIFSANSGDSLTGGAGNDTIYGWGGNDTLSAGTGNQVIHSESGYDLVTGGAGNDTLISVAGNDTMIGGTGNTTFVVNSSTDVIEAQSTGSNVNTVLTSVGYVAPNNVQNLTGTGSAAITLTGNDLNNVITANSGNDTLVAGSGVATLLGGAGSDTFVVNNVSDVVQAQSTGSNTVLTSVDYVASANVLNLSGIGSADITLTGNDLNNVVTANSGSDTLIAGTGVATLVGGTGNDTFMINNVNDVVQAQSTGSNTVLTSVSYAAPANVQNITGSGSANITLTGNDLNNVITANSGNDTIDGGSGNSTLIGGTGLDTFVMGYGIGSDTVIDSSAQGGIVQLNPGLNISDLSATQQGNDLLLQINGTSKGMLIQGYYSNPQTSWSIQDAAGNATTPQAIFDAIAQQPKATQAENTWITQTKAGIINGYLAQGFTMQADGTLNLLSGGQVSASQEISNSTTTQFQYNYQNGVTSWSPAASISNQTGSYAGSNSIYGQSASVNVVSTTSNDSVVYADPAQAYSYNGGTEWLQVSWGNKSPVTIAAGNYYTSLIYKYALGFSADPNATNLGAPIGYAGTYVVYSNVINFETGTVTNILSSPGNLQTAGTNPQAVAAQYNISQIANEIQQINLGTGGQTVWANAQSLVISNSGNDTIYNAGFAYGGTGNDMMNGGGTLMAGTGNDTLIGGNIMIAGSGNDQIFAGLGDATFQIDPTSVSTDIIGGAGNGATSNSPLNMGLPRGAMFMSMIMVIPPTVSTHNVAFGAGITLSNINLSWGQIVGAITGQSTDPQLRYTTLNLSWGANNQSIQVMIPHSSDPSGSGVSEFTFADGTTVSMAEMIAMAPPAPTFDPEIFQFQQGMGAAVLGAGYSSINFDPGITAGNSQFVLNGTDLLITDGASGDSLLVQGFAPNGATGNYSIGQFQFADGSQGYYGNDGQGNAYLNAYDSSGTLMGDFWQHSDGSSGNDTYNPDGSSSGIRHNADGSYSNYTNDGTGDVTTTNYDVYNNRLGDSWMKADGSYGSDIFNANGSSSGASHNTDGSYSSYINDGLGNITTTNYDVSGNVLKSTVVTNDGQGDITTTSSEPNGSYQQTWITAAGNSGSNDYNAVTGEMINTTTTVGTGYSTISDYLQNIGGVYGYTEAKTSSVYANGSSSASDYLQNIGGIYGYTDASTSNVNADGSTSSSDYAQNIGGTYGYNEAKSSNVNADGSAYAADYIQNIGGVYGDDESKAAYTYADHSTYSTDYVSYADGSYFSSWNRSDGTAASFTSNADGTWNDSWVHADGSQGIDAGNNHLLYGAAAIDSLTAPYGNSLLIGGAGNDTIVTDYATNIIAFNKGDGQDALYASSGQNNTLSLGGNFAYSDLALQKSGTDLILDVGTADSITFKGWYAGNSNIVNLQVVASAMSDFAPSSTNVLSNSNVEEFNFQTLVSEFDQAQLANPSTNPWAVTNALLSAHLSGSNTAALGGDLAYVYGTQGNLSGFGVAAAANEISSAQFGNTAQTLNPWPTLNTGTAQIR